MQPSSRALWIGVGLSIAVAAATLGVLGASIAQLEGSELQLEGEPSTLSKLQQSEAATRVSVRLADTQLRLSEHVLFELCVSDPLTRTSWRGAFDAVVFRWPGTQAGTGKPELMLRVPLDAEHLAQAQRDEDGACLPLGGGVIEHAGRHTLELVYADKPPPPDVMNVPLRGRVLARTPLRALHRNAVFVLVAMVLLLLCALFALPRAKQAEAVVPGRLSARALVLGAVALLALIGATFVPMFGAAQGFAKGLLLVAMQSGGALLLAGPLQPSRRAALGLLAPQKRWPFIAAAPFIALVLAQCARIALQIVPSTGKAPIQSFVEWPSGMLAFAAIGVIAPLAEELFFRGLLYRIALPLGRTAAGAITLLLFIALHLAQSWGNWGGVVAVALTGLVLTILRVTSGSLLPCALAHVLYNAALSLRAL